MSKKTADKATSKANNGQGSEGQAAPGETSSGDAPDPELLEKATKLRSTVRETFGSVTMSMMALPRYRHLPLSELQGIVLEPLMRDRVAIARVSGDAEPLADIAGVAFWASVSEDVDTKIREQIKAGVFPVRLTPDEWASGEINWLFDVIAPNPEAVGRVIANFRQVVTKGELRLHPLVTRLVDKETLEKMNAQAMQHGESAASK